IVFTVAVPCTPLNTMNTFSPRCLAHRDLQSFPTRRSSDLRRPRTVRSRQRCRVTSPNAASRLARAPAQQPASSPARPPPAGGRRSEEHTLNSSHEWISYAVFCLKKKTRKQQKQD